MTLLISISSRQRHQHLIQGEDRFRVTLDPDGTLEIYRIRGRYKLLVIIN